MRRLLTTAVAAGLAGAMALTAPAVAAPTPTTGPGLAALQAAVSHRIDLRLAALTRDSEVITDSKKMTDAHIATLSALIAADQTGLTALKAKVNAETTVAAVRADQVTMIDSYRIYILVGPKVRLTRAADAEAAELAKLRTVHDKLADLVAKDKAAGKDTSNATDLLADMSAQLAKMGPTLDGQVDKLLALQPGPDGPGLTASVSNVRTALVEARGDLKAAVEDAKQVRDILKGLKK
jgi:hypothetical protein